VLGAAIAGVVGLIVTIVATPWVERFAWRVGAVDVPGGRKVHERPTPTLGGLAMLAGFLAAIVTARILAELGDEALAPLFRGTSEPAGLALGAVVIAGVGVLDDLLDLSPPAKLAGQIVAALFPVLGGIQLVHAWIPGIGVISLSPDLGVPLTVLGIVAMINAVNTIDGLDGLAAGVVAIAAVAFTVFAYGTHSIAAVAPTSATLAATALAGVSLGFLWHNFHPARIFMGDTGAMMLGLVLAAAGIAFVGRTTDPGYLDCAGVFPLAIPVLVVGLAVLDTVVAIVRRLRRGQAMSVGDREHLHHRLLQRGFGHRRAVLVLYLWSVVLAFGAVGLALLPARVVVATVAALSLLGVTVTVTGVRRVLREEEAPTDAARGRTPAG
jgi:UDP-GlcNAc:undecaprenyl-phosphate/decaprenyl-phosphate GlcNAc-1-phosphate transferase